MELASQFGRYGYRRITALLRQRGWHVNHKRVERIWRREGLRYRRSNRRNDSVGRVSNFTGHPLADFQISHSTSFVSHVTTG